VQKLVNFFFILANLLVKNVKSVETVKDGAKILIGYSITITCSKTDKRGEGFNYFVSEESICEGIIFRYIGRLNTLNLNNPESRFFKGSFFLKIRC
jgi:hypothetical protein